MIINPEPVPCVLPPERSQEVLDALEAVCFSRKTTMTPETLACYHAAVMLLIDKYHKEDTNAHQGYPESEKDSVAWQHEKANPFIGSREE